MFCEYTEVCADANKVDTNSLQHEGAYEPTLSNCTTNYYTYQRYYQKDVLV